MATPPPFTSTPTSTTVDTSYLARTRALQASQISSLLLPPAYTLFALYRRTPLSASRVLRASWAGVAGAAVLGGVGEIVSLHGSDPVVVAERAWMVGHDARRIRAQDYSLIGAFLGSLTTSAILWKRAPRVHLILGGAVLGEAAGYAAHLYQTYAMGSPSATAASANARPVPVTAAEGERKAEEAAVVNAQTAVQTPRNVTKSG